MIVRDAREHDLAALADIYNSGLSGTCHIQPRTLSDRRGWWSEHLAPAYPVLVGEEGSRVTGYASLSRWMEGPVYARTVEVSVFLAPEMRGRGQGTALLNAILERAARIGHHVVIARVWADNTLSLALCRKCGFEVTGVQREVGLRNGSPLDCVIMQRILAP